MSRLVSLHDALPEVAADFAAALPGEAEPRLAILDGVPDASVSEQVPNAAEWMDPANDEQVLLLVGGVVTSLTARWSDRDELAVECASALQTVVMDEGSAPWPVLPDGGGIAEPGLRDGRPQWLAAGRTVPLGNLTAALR